MASGSFGRNFGGGRGGRSDAMHRPPISQEYNSDQYPSLMSLSIPNSSAMGVQSYQASNESQRYGSYPASRSARPMGRAYAGESAYDRSQAIESMTFQNYGERRDTEPSRHYRKPAMEDSGPSYNKYMVAGPLPSHAPPAPSIGGVSSSGASASYSLGYESRDRQSRLPSSMDRYDRSYRRSRSPQDSRYRTTKDTYDDRRYEDDQDRWYSGHYDRRQTTADEQSSYDEQPHFRSRDDDWPPADLKPLPTRKRGKRPALRKRKPAERPRGNTVACEPAEAAMKRGEIPPGPSSQVAAAARSVSPSLPPPASAGKRSSLSPGPSGVFQRLGAKLAVADRLGAKVDDDSNDEITSEPNRLGEEGHSTSTQSPSKRNKKPFLKLKCPHCNLVIQTFRKYTMHLSTPAHKRALNIFIAKWSKNMSLLRKSQRKEQKQIELSLMNENGLILDAEGRPRKSNFCNICKLKFHQDVSLHEESLSHHKMCSMSKTRCDLCKASFKNTPSYFTHTADLSHVCKVAELKLKSESSQPHDEDASANETTVRVEEVIQPDVVQIESDHEGSVMDIDNFVTLDEVGDDDDEAENEDDKVESEEVEEEATETTEAKEAKEEVTEMKEEPKSPKEDLKAANKAVVSVKEEHDIPVKEEEEEEKPAIENKEIKTEVKQEQITEQLMGVDFIKPVTMHYCDLCHKFLPRHLNKAHDRILAEHCQGQNHIVLFKSRSESHQPSVASNEQEDDDQLDYEAD